MTESAGTDSAKFFGDAELAGLKAGSNLSWRGYCLAPAPSHGDTSWMGRSTAVTPNPSAP